MSTLKKQEKESFFRAYVTEALQAIVNNTAKFAGGTIIKKSYTEILQEIRGLSSGSSEESEEKEPEETAEDVIARISKLFTEM